MLALGPPPRAALSPASSPPALFRTVRSTNRDAHRVTCCIGPEADASGLQSAWLSTLTSFDFSKTDPLSNTTGPPL